MKRPLTPSLPEMAAVCDLMAGAPWRPEPDPEPFCRLASRQGVAGMLYGMLRDRQAPEIPGCLERAYYATAARNLVLLSALEDLELDCGREGLRVLVLKGAALLCCAYQDPGLRPMEDLDILVRPEDREAFTRMLAGAGYSPRRDRDNMFSRGETTIDLHVHALNTDRVPGRTGLFPAGMDPVWEGAVPLGPGSHSLYRPGDETFILLLCQHALKHSFSRLIWLADIRQMLSGKNARFHDALSREASRLSQEKALGYCLYLLHGLLGFRVPAELYGLTARLGSLERRLLAASFSGEARPLSGELLSLLALARARERARFAAGVLFPRESRYRSLPFYAAERLLLALRNSLLILRRLFLS